MAPPNFSLPPAASPVGLALALSLLCIVLYIVSVFISVPYPKGVALIREPPGARRFSWRTRLAYYTDCSALFREAYHEVSLSETPLPMVVQTLWCPVIRS